MSKKVDFGIKSQLITKEELARRVKELGEQITKDFKDEKEPLVVIVLLKGSVVFMADLIERLDCHWKLILSKFLVMKELKQQEKLKF